MDTKSKKKKTHNIALTKPVERPRMPLTLMLRMFLLGSVAVVASGYAVYRYYFVPRTPMMQPATPDAATPEPSSSEWLPAPELVPVPASSP